MTGSETIHQPAEARCADELAALAAADHGPKPPGWRLSPRSVEHFIMGSREALPGPGGRPVTIAPKFVGERRLVQVAIATLASDRALMLAGEPGTAKCVKHDTLLVDTRTGERFTIAEAVRRREIVVASLGEDYRLRPQAPTDYLDNGIRSCYRVTTHLGRTIEVTINHPFLTANGWRPLGELQIGDRIAVPRVLPFFGQDELSDAHVILLAHLIAGDRLTGSMPQFTNTNADMQHDFAAAVTAAFPGLFARWHPNGHACSISHGCTGRRLNPCTRWLTELGLMGLGSAEKFIPDIIFMLPRRQVALFLNRLFSGDGFIHLRASTGQVTIDYASKSSRLILGVQHLLLRFGINARVRRLKSGHYRLYIYGDSACRTLLREIGVLGRAHVAAALERLSVDGRAENPDLDTIPASTWPRLAQAATAAGYATVAALVKADRGVMYKGGGPRTSQGMSRARLLRLAALADAPDLIQLGQSDIYWDPIASIEYAGEHQVYDLSMATTHNFVANDFIVHNSWLSEHLSAAIGGTSQLIVQGTAGTTEEQIKYSWNYALLIAEGPSRRALVESPLLRGMQRGLVVRLEEITRCAAEVQDALISVLSEKQVAIPELDEIVPARRGFAVIATANTRDRGVNEMSAALKRRFNFVTIPVIADVEQEAAIVERRSRELLGELGVAAEPPRDLVKLLTTVFAELRRGQTLDGTTKVKPPSTVLSTAELISVVANGVLLGSFFGGGRTTAQDLFAGLVGAVAKENSADLAVLQEYLETVVKGRGERPWRDFYAAGREALKG